MREGKTKTYVQMEEKSQGTCTLYCEIRQACLGFGFRFMGMCDP